MSEIAVASMFTPEVSMAAQMGEAMAAIESADNDSGETPEVETTEAIESAEPSEEKPEKAPKVVDASVAELQKMANAGDLDGLLEKLGIDPKGSKIPASRFAEFRKMQAKERAKTSAAMQRAEAKEAEIKRLIDETVKTYEPYAKARELRDKGDTLGALKSAFGADFDKVIEEAIAQQSGKDPELVALKRKEEAREKADQDRRDAEAQARAQAQRAEQERAYVKSLGEQLVASDDPEIAVASKKPAFVNAVYRAQLVRYDGGRGVEITPDEAAQEVIETLRAAHLEWSEVFGSTAGKQSGENTARAGKAPSITDSAGKQPGKRPAKGLSRAVVAPTKSVDEMDEVEARDYFAKLMRGD